MRAARLTPAPPPQEIPGDVTADMLAAHANRVTAILTVVGRSRARDRRDEANRMALTPFLVAASQVVDLRMHSGGRLTAAALNWCLAATGDGYALRQAVADDVPRYEPPAVDDGCIGRGPRGGRCRNRGLITRAASVLDAEAGTWALLSACVDHRAALDAMAWDMSKHRPPAPNTGGRIGALFPGHDWTRLYLWARPGLAGPTPGLPGGPAAQATPTLRVVGGGPREQT